MEAEDALEKFLSNALTRKKERFMGSISKTKTRSKLLDAIYHDLGDCFDTSKIVSFLPYEALSLPGYRFAPPDVFGEQVENLGSVCSGIDVSFLVVSATGILRSSARKHTSTTGFISRFESTLLSPVVCLEFQTFL